MKLQTNTMHDMKKQSATGFGSWLQCKDCGATVHTKLWWIGGYKSKEQPHCTPNNINDWKSRATVCTTDDME